MEFKDLRKGVKQMGSNHRMQSRAENVVYEDSAGNRFQFKATVGGVDEDGQFVEGGFDYTGTFEARWPKVAADGSEAVKPVVGDVMGPDDGGNRMYQVTAVSRHASDVEWKVQLGR